MNDDTLNTNDEALDALNALPYVLDPTLPLNPGSIGFAYTYYSELCCADPKSRAQAAKALLALGRPWSITERGELRLPGSGNDIYIVSLSSCCLEGQYTTNRKTGKHSPKLCKGWIFAGGGCYHRAAYELLRIAQYADQLLG